MTARVPGASRLRRAVLFAGAAVLLASAAALAPRASAQDVPPPGAAVRFAGDALPVQDAGAGAAWLHPRAVLGGGGVRMPGGIASLARAPAAGETEPALLTGGVDGRVLAWPGGRGPAVLVLAGTPPIGFVATDGTRVVAVDGDGTLWSAPLPPAAAAGARDATSTDAGTAANVRAAAAADEDGATDERAATGERTAAAEPAAPTTADAGAIRTIPGLGRVAAAGRGEHAHVIVVGSTADPGRARADLRRPDEAPAHTAVDALRSTAAAADEHVLVWAASSPDDDGPHARVERIDLATGAPRAVLALDDVDEARDTWINAIALAPDGVAWLGTADGRVLAWRPGTPAALDPPRLLRGARVNALAADAHWIVAGGPDGVVRWATQDGSAPERARLLHPGGVSALVLLDGDRVLGAGFDGHVRTLDLDSGAVEARDVGHEAAVTDLAWSPDGRALLSGSLDGTARLWDAATGASRARLDHGPAVATGGAGDEARASGPGGFVTAVAWSPRGDLVATACDDGRVRLWDAGDGRPHGPPLPLAGPADVLFGPDGDWVAAVGDDGLLHRWFVDGALPLDRTPVESRLLFALARGRAPDVLFAGSSIVHEVDAQQGVVRRTLAVPRAPIDDMLLHPDGRTLVLGAADRAVHLVDLLAEPSEPARVLRGHTGRVAAVAVSPDGAWIVSGAQNDPELRAWHGDAHAPAAPLPAHAGGVLALAFSPDGRVLASGGRDEVVRLWTLAPADAR